VGALTRLSPHVGAALAAVALVSAVVIVVAPRMFAARLAAQDGDLELRYRSFHLSWFRFWIASSMITPAFKRPSSWTVLLAFLGGAIGVFPWVMNAVLRQRVLVTATHVLVPASRWSRAERAIPLDGLEVVDVEDRRRFVSLLHGDDDLHLDFRNFSDGIVAYLDFVAEVERRADAATARPGSTRR
jgi:hypothetical protein